MKKRSYGGTNGSLPVGGREAKNGKFPGAQIRRLEYHGESEHFPALARQLTSSAGRTRVSAQVEGFFVVALSDERRSKTVLAQVHL